METPVQPGFRVIRGPDWSYKNQDGGKGHAGTVLVMPEEHRPDFPKQNVLVQWDNGDKGLYRVGYDQAFDLRIIDTANAVCHHKIWCDGCNADEIKGIRWRCTECYAIDLCTTCYMNDEHDLSHVFMRVLTSHKTSMGPKMLSRSSSPHIALRGSFPGAKVVRHTQWYKRLRSDTLLGKIINSGQTSEERVKVEAMVEFSSTTERIGLTRIICTLPGPGGYVYDGHLPLLGDHEPVNEGDKVMVTATPAELEKLHKRRGLWEPDMTKTFRKKGFVNKRTNSGDFQVTFSYSQETFTMNSAALRKIHGLCLGQLVHISDDIEMVKRLQFGHGGWTAAMKQAIGKVGKVVEIDGSDIHVKIKGNHKFIFNSANLNPDKTLVSKHEEKNMADSFRDFTHLTREPDMDITTAAAAGDIRAVERILAIYPELIHYEPKPGKTLLGYIAANGDTHMVKFLVEKGAFIESTDDNGCTPLFHAAIANKYETVKYLLEQGADVNTTNHQGFTSLSLACTKGLFECAHYLLMHGADMNQKGKEGVTPVLMSVDSGHRKIVDLIMDRKEADLKTVSKSLVSAMHGAADINNTYAMTKLLDKVPRLVEAVDGGGRTPLFSAALKGCYDAAELLIKKGDCDVNVTENVYGQCPLGLAIARGHFNVVGVLVRNGADPNIPDHSGNASLHFAITFIGATRGRYIEEEPYMAEMKKKWGHVGIKTNTDALVAFLVSNGADLNAKNCRVITIRELLLKIKDPILHHLLHPLVEIQTQREKDIARQQTTANRPLRNVIKKSNGTETRLNSVSSLLKKKNTTIPDSKKRSAGNSSELVSTSSGSQQKGDLQQIQAQLQRKDEEIEILRSRTRTLEHLVKKKISFSCGHNVIRSIAELIPECPNCSEPITSFVDL